MPAQRVAASSPPPSWSSMTATVHMPGRVHKTRDRFGCDQGDVASLAFAAQWCAPQAPCPPCPVRPCIATTRNLRARSASNQGRSRGRTPSALLQRPCFARPHSRGRPLRPRCSCWDSEAWVAAASCVRAGSEPVGRGLGSIQLFGSKIECSVWRRSHERRAASQASSASSVSIRATFPYDHAIDGQSSPGTGQSSPVLVSMITAA